MRKLLPAAVAAALAGCSLTSPKEDPVQVKLGDLDARVTRIERVVQNQSLLELAQRLDTIENEVRGLRGQADELANGSEASRKRERDLYADLDRRIGALEHGGLAPAGAGAAPPDPGATGTPAQTPGQTDYAQALDVLKAGKYPEAIAAFKKYLNTYPSGELADNAQYWLGEAYYVTRDYEKAIVAFRAVGEQWPNSRKAADALVKLGYSQFELKRYNDAQFTLTEVTRRFPDTDAAKLAAEKLRQIPARPH